MEMERVFSSKITRSQIHQKSHLYDLLNISPATPIEVSGTKNEAYDFHHKTEKYYISQKKSRFKVVTVAEIRKQFEQEVFSYLPNEIESQQNMLLRKIRAGSTNDETTRELALNLLNKEKPMSRSTWQMLTNINPERHAYNKQLVLWNGRYIQVNGSKGGERKFICQYDLSSCKLHKKLIKENNPIYKRKSLLKESLCTKFKPGPLSRKKYLDDSYQKYHIGKTQIINVPKAGLDVYPSYGISIESNLTKYLNSFRNSNGDISKKWAEFAVSMLGVVKNRTVAPVDANNCITFDLAYKYEQKNILMRCGTDNLLNAISVQDDKIFKNNNDVTVNMSDVEDIMHKILDSVEISLKQDNMFTMEEEIRSIAKEHSVHTIHCKEKPKRKYCELDRLDVTVIQIPENTSKDEQEICYKDYCNLGCICASLECKKIIKNHCGLPECMFKCQCDFLKYKHLNLLPNTSSELMPCLVNLNTEINLNLAKEEKKFHQTVVVSGEKSILLKAQKRNWKASKKYGDFYKNVILKNPTESIRVLSIVALKLNARNIEPWCMVHKLYKCFCKGRFNNTSLCETINDSAVNSSKVSVVNKENPLLFDVSMSDKNKSTYSRNLRTRYNRTNSVKSCEYNNINIDEIPLNTSEFDINSCARIKPYKGRKYSNNYYKVTNNKILEMEKNDKNLQKRIKTILNNAEANEEYDFSKKKTNKKLDPPVEIVCNKSIDGPNSNFLYKSNLATWLEASYKLYKVRNERGKLILNPPKPGKLALYPWAFLLQRYKERKNMFLVSKQKPYRIFMAISIQDEILKDCIFIDEIRFCDLYKFPLTVRNLLTNVTNLENIFYIMYGLSNCWELIGSVTKLSEPLGTDKAVPNNSDHESSSTSQTTSVQNSFITKNICEMMSEEDTNSDTTFSSSSSPNSDEVHCDEDVDKNPSKNATRTSVNNLETSKWFIMNVENDFTEIQFHNRGFFVKYDSILKAINVARKTGKTVRLSTQTCASKSSYPQFGIYAIPDSKGRYVFVGPYEINEPLGIETIKTTLNLKKHKNTRGIWITTDKLDNMNVINNPLLFMPSNNIDYNIMVPIDTDSNLNVDIIKSPKNNSRISEKQNLSTSLKAIKPIRIRKTNGFYHLAPNGILKKIPLQDSKKEEKYSQKNHNVENHNLLLVNTSDSDNFDKQNKEESNLLTSNASKDIIEEIKPKCGMLVLKPDEINKRLLDGSFKRNNQVGLKNKITSDESTIEDDIQNFLSTELPYEKSEEYSTIVISDDSEINADDDFSCDRKEYDVWIQCTNIYNIGWIKGNKNDNNLLSFEFPGFKPSEFYHKEEAFKKINQ